MAAITVDNISKTYGKEKTLAVDSVSFSVEEGEIFGLIGPDGAGKTSIFRILTTLLLPDSGNATVAGFDIITGYKEIRNSVGYMPGKFSLYQDLTIEENLRFFATIFNTTMEANYHLIKDIYIQIEPFKARRAGKLSGGMKQKLALCCALIHKPKVLFLDEPTTGVDPVSRKELWEMLKRLKSQGITIVVSTPYMDEASLCDRIALMQEGKILTIDTPEGLSQNYPYKLFAIRADNLPKVIQQLNRFSGMKDVYAFGEWVHASFEDNLQPGTVQDYLELKGFREVEIKPVKATVEDTFIRLLKS